MKIILLHCDYIKFRALKKALKSVDDLSETDKKEKEVKECLVVLTAVEKGDSKETIYELVESIKKVAKDVKANNVVLYPYAHLSSNLASPDVAVEVLDVAEKELKQNFKVVRAPFGYYKEFELKVKGHPLSELSREFGSKTEIKSGKEKVQLEKDISDYSKLLREISRSKLDTSKLKENDHRILGQQMDLFSFNDVAPGMVFWHNNGLIIYNELVNFWRDVHRARGYQEISTPQIMDKKLWQISGHWDKYKDNIFLTDYEGRTFAVKPMNCPGGILVYKTGTKSYKDLPLRVGELGIVHRQELSGVLSGLFRVVKFTQDDAHLFCTEDQLEDEISGVMDLVDFFYNKFGLSYRLELSTRPEKRIGEDKIWDRAEKALENVLKKKKAKFKVNKGDGAFYGPKIDFHIKDSLGREWQCATIQLDFLLPERFELEYIDKDNSRKRPIMLHRVIYGSLERFIGKLLENTNGRLPTWLAPVQVRVLTFTDRSEKYAKKVVEELGREIPNLRLDTDFRNTPVPGKVKEAELMRIPYIIVIGDKEQKKGTLAVRHEGKVNYDIKLNEFIKDIKKLIEERK